MAVAFVNAVSANGNPTTSFTIATDGLTVLGDLMEIFFTHRGTGDGTITDNSGDGVAWTRKGEALFASGTFTVQHYYKRATAPFVGNVVTISGSGMTNSCAPIFVVNTGVISTGDPYEAWSAEANASGDESHASITTLTDGAMVALVVGNSPDLAISGQSTTSPGALAERVEKLSTGGTDSSISYASEVKATAGATGALVWTQTNAASGSIAYALKPEPEAVVHDLGDPPDITAGNPTLGSPAIGQVHALTATGVTTGNPTLGAPALAEEDGVDDLTANGITAGAPTLGAPTVGQVHGLSAAANDAGAPTLGSPAIGQVHGLTATGITAGAPTVGAPTLEEAGEPGTDNLTAVDITAGAPTLGAPRLIRIGPFKTRVAGGRIVR